MRGGTLARAVIVGLAALALAAVGWLWLQSETSNRRATVARGAVARGARSVVARGARSVKAIDDQAVTTRASTFSTPRPVAREEPRMSHPLTAEHRRIQRENALIGAMNDALDLGDPPRLRALLKQYRAAEPGDEHRLQAGYELLADCLEFPGDASRSAAQHYYRSERASTLRRFVRRICLEGERASGTQGANPG